ncbi:MAG: hypothetical protein LUQ04_10085 [Methanoregula sp.]|nr:hypothetical protein [Methanoregula sp.]
MLFRFLPRQPWRGILPAVCCAIIISGIAIIVINPGNSFSFGTCGPDSIPITGSTVSWHTRRLCEARLIISAKEGRNVRYRLTPVAAKVIDELRCL